MSAKRAVRSSVLVVTFGFLAGASGGCVAPPPPAPEQMSRTQVETAPADLQLLCANAVAKASGVGSAKILPVSSGKINPKPIRSHSMPVARRQAASSIRMAMSNPLNRSDLLVQIGL